MNNSIFSILAKNENKIFYILIFSLFLNYGYSQDLDSLRIEQLKQSKTYPLDLFPDRDKDCSIEFGAVLYSNEGIGRVSLSSCAGSCHSTTNQLKPISDIQAGQGFVFDARGRVVSCKYFPADYQKDLVGLNTPSAKTRYKNKVLFDGKTTKDMQPRLQFGGTAHMIDFERLQTTQIFQHYTSTCYNVAEANEDVFVQAIVDFQDSGDFYNNFTNWIRTGESSRRLRKNLKVVSELQCLNCHVGIGGVSEGQGQAVLNSTGKTLTGDMVQVRTWNDALSSPRWFWNGSYVSGSKIGLKKHLEQEGIEHSDKDLKRLIDFIKKDLK